MDQGVRVFTSRAKSEFGVTLPSAMEGGVKHAKKSLSDRKDDIHKNCTIYRKMTNSYKGLVFV